VIANVAHEVHHISESLPFWSAPRFTQFRVARETSLVLTLRLTQGSLIVVPVEINHSGPYDFLVDTGAQITTVDSFSAVNLGLKAQGTTGVAA